MSGACGDLEVAYYHKLTNGYWHSWRSILLTADDIWRTVCTTEEPDLKPAVPVKCTHFICKQVFQTLNTNLL